MCDHGAFLPLMCVNISLYLGVQPRFHDGSLSFSFFVFFLRCKKKKKKKKKKKVDIRLRSIPSASAYNIYFTFQFIIFERQSFENNNETNFFLRSSDSCCYFVVEQ